MYFATSWIDFPRMAFSNFSALAYSASCCLCAPSSWRLSTFFMDAIRGFFLASTRISPDLTRSLWSLPSTTLSDASVILGRSMGAISSSRLTSTRSSGLAAASATSSMPLPSAGGVRIEASPSARRSDRTRSLSSLAPVRRRRSAVMKSSYALNDLPPLRTSSRAIVRSVDQF